MCMFLYFLSQDQHILLSYNSHNNYVMQLAAFGSVHELSYKHHLYILLDVSDSLKMIMIYMYLLTNEGKVIQLC